MSKVSFFWEIPKSMGKNEEKKDPELVAQHWDLIYPQGVLLVSSESFPEPVESNCLITSLKYGSKCDCYL